MNRKENEVERNRPSEEGRNNDPDLRDESAHQPGVSTMSKSETDDDNEHVTQTALQDQPVKDFDKDDGADPAFDDELEDDE